MARDYEQTAELLSERGTPVTPVVERTIDPKLDDPDAVKAAELAVEEA